LYTVSYPVPGGSLDLAVVENIGKDKK